MNFRFHLVLLAALLLSPICAHAVYVENMPTTQIQPSGDTIHMFVTGDECYQRFHDAQNYTIVQAPSGWWVYALVDSEKGVRPSAYPVGTVDPATLGVKPGISISRAEWLQRRHAWDIPEQYRRVVPKTSGRNHGDFCNLVIFIRFADDTPYSRPLSNIDQMFSDSSTATVSSVYNYFKHASYNKIFIRTHYAPTPDGDSIRSYRSPHPRDYYRPYTEANPIGYTNYRERSNREFELLVSAVNYINDSAPVPTSYNLDCDNDGYIDNVNFVVKGAATGWNDLLWPHKWSLYGRDVYINGKQVSTFNFALEGSGADYFGTSTFCHEMFHSLGAPDLYRYNRDDEISPVGQWDLMATNSKPPQHMSAYLKYKYGNWLDSIPLITKPGKYTINSLADSIPDTVALRFPSADSDQFYVVEYRDNTETFERQLPGRGLIIYRVDTRFDGNAGFDGEEYFDEVWVFRPGSNSNDVNGQLNEAYFSRLKKRTQFTPNTDIYPYLSDGTPDVSFAITNVSVPGRTISFNYTNHPSPSHITIQRVTTSTASLKWMGNFDSYTLAYRKQGSDQPFSTLSTSMPFATIANLASNTVYELKIRGHYNLQDGIYTDSSDWVTTSFNTEVCNNVTNIDIISQTPSDRNGLPFATNQSYNFSEQLFLAGEMEGPLTIHAFSINYNYTQGIHKDSCTVYMGHTTLDKFNYEHSYIPIEEMTPVYQGKLDFVHGPNKIYFNTPFQYNGTDNLVLAIHDNSGVTTYAGDRFLCHTTNDNLSSVYYSTSHDAYPYTDSTGGSYTLHNFRNDIQFIGCPDNGSQYYACIISDNYEMGRVTGEGLYNPNETVVINAYPKHNYRFHSWHDGNTDSPRTIVITQDTVLVAHFTSPLGIQPTDTDGGYIIATRQNNITIQGAEGQPVAIYDLLGRTVAHSGSSHTDPITLTLPRSGIYIVRIGNEKPLKLILP